MNEYYDRDGNPIGDTEWLAGFKDRTYQRVAFDEVGDVQISTVWLGLNHAFGDGPPLIFESMVFGGAHDEDCERYSTEAEALAGHALLLAREREVAA